ncbi:hypothetical protein [Streptomyces sp. XD-27]|uniref:hypothetical protein n=1 Tax=Streptomyces sp. XD-27 TaxID=3062779 RepID=UPI0026F4648E|nr:hypothetical protein [Streptomyces sp. XD-27]WKX74004.1 hypothetical protein Q3Y56_32735 [Streptomyces sp. XD-27]
MSPAALLRPVAAEAARQYRPPWRAVRRTARRARCCAWVRAADLACERGREPPALLAPEERQRATRFHLSRDRDTYVGHAVRRPTRTLQKGSHGD